MRGFFAVKQAPSPIAAQVLVSEAKPFLSSYRESYEAALLEKEGTVKISVCEFLSCFYFGSSYSLELVKYLTHSRCSKMSDERMRKCCNPMGSAHVVSNPMGTGDESPEHFLPGADTPMSAGLSGSRVVCVSVTCSTMYQMMLHLDEDFLEPGSLPIVSLSHLNKISYLILYLFSYRSQVKDLM